MYSTVIGAINWTDLHLSPVALDLGFFQLKWYSLAYLAGIFAAYFYMLKLIDPAPRLPGAMPTTSCSTRRSG
jgi:phosphatidylglycerol:prolipoprotein diacylglycerol transferase